MHTRFQAACGLIRRQHSSQREAACDWLGDGDHIGFHIVVLICEPLAGAPQSALNLIDQQQRAASGSECPRRFQELAAHKLNSTFALNSLNRDGADAVVELLLEIFHIVEFHKFNSRKKRRIHFAILSLSGSREGAIRSAMEGVFHGKDAPLRLQFSGRGFLGIGTSDLQRAFPGFGAAVRE